MRAAGAELRPGPLAGAAGFAAAAAAAALALGDAQSATLLLLGAALGATLLTTGFGFAGAYRAALAARDMTGVRAQIAMLAAASLLFAPMLAAGEMFGRPLGAFVAPAGLAVAAGAAMFGVGMQLAGGCGSGTLVALGAGSRRMLAVLPAFVAGSFWGSLDQPAWEALPAFPPVSLGETLGWTAGLAAQLGALAVLWRVLPGAARVPRRLLAGAGLLAALNAATLAAAGHPWGITWAFALAGAKAAAALGWSPEGSMFWTHAPAAAALAAPLLSDTTAIMDAGLVLGAALAAAAAGAFGRFARPTPAQWLAAALGGLLMGYGARISGGCNVGAFFSGIASFSLHGWLWIAAALAGSWIGVRLRPAFGYRD